MRGIPMQKFCSELTERLLKSLDKEYNVVDMQAVVDIISVLERTTITKEVLENTRLGKHVNELRRKTSNEALAKRAKDLVRRWRDMVLPSIHSTPQPTLADTAPSALNGAKEVAFRNLKSQSPVLREQSLVMALKSLHNPSLNTSFNNPLRVLSPTLSVHSDHSRSPNASLNNKQSITPTSNHRISSCSRNASPVLGSSSQNHATEAVPRTHSSNKRLRKEESGSQHYQSPHGTAPTMEQVKKQRLNGENISGNLNSQVPSPTLKERISERFTEVPLEATDDSLGPKKRGRKKGSKSVKQQPLPEDNVKEKLASISRNPKLKTTQELLADLQARGSNCSPIGSANAQPSQSVAEPPSMEDVLRGSSNEQVSKYLRCSSQKNSQSLHKNLASSETSSGNQQRLTKAHGAWSKSEENCRESSLESCQDRLHEDDRSANATARSSTSQSSGNLTVEEILAKLPPLDRNAIDWSDCEEQNGAECSSPQRRDVTAEDLERLHTKFVEGLNGNYQPARLSSAGACSNECDERSNARDSENRVLSGLSNVDSVKSVHNNQIDSTEFREWHDMLARPSYQDETLHILPYVIIN